MDTIKKGSKGEAVKILQKALGITADGVFGPGTEKALKEWQKEHGLTVDGICGAATWKSMGLTENGTKVVDSSVVYCPLSTHITKLAGRAITFLAIHFTAGTKSSKGYARNVKRIFEKRSASADFCVDDEEMVQINPDPKNYYCWAVGDKAKISTGGASLAGQARNRNTISIEVCSSLKAGFSLNYANTDGWYFTEGALENARKLTRILMKKFNIPLERVVRHYDISGKLCPGLKGWNNGNIYNDEGKVTGRNSSEEWEKFKASL